MNGSRPHTGPTRSSRYHHPIAVEFPTRAGRLPPPVAASGEPVATLRGARVAIDHRRAGRAVLVACLVGLVVAAGVLYAAGAHQNAQVSSLRDHGVAVDVTVTGCLGQLGGSGSNAAGYTCRGTYTLGGHRHGVAIPGSSLLSPGQKVREITVAADPGLVSSPDTVATRTASWTVFVLPTVLLVITLVGAGRWLLRGRRTPPGRRAGSP